MRGPARSAQLRLPPGGRLRSHAEREKPMVSHSPSPRELCGTGSPPTGVGRWAARPMATPALGS